MANASATAQIALSVKATLDGFNITWVSQLPTIRSVKILTMELFNMAAAVESNMTGGKHGHMYIILSQPDYCIATKNNSANVDQLQKPNDVNPKFKTEKKEDLTQLEHETKEALAAYITQEEVSKEISQRMVASIEPEFIEELKNEYMGYTNKTPKLFLAHLA